MVTRRTAITVEEAVKKVMEFARKGKHEIVSIENAFERYLAEDLIASQDVPAFDRSPYDGYAIRVKDSEVRGSRFEVVGEIRAGSIFYDEVKSDQAVRIMTGAQIPIGCHAVVMTELVKEYEDNGKTYIQLKQSVKKGDNISNQGEEVRKGDILVRKGTCINPGVIALLATFGYDEVLVVKQPIVGVIAMGTDLLDVNEPLEQGKIRDSNTYMILAQIQRLGGKVKYFGRVNGEYNVYLSAVKKAISQVDVLITTGGVSVGEYDYLPEIYEDIGAAVLFNKVAMRPGSVTTVAHKEGKLLFGLSGNPSACYVGFELYVRPVINSYLKKSEPHMKRVKAILNEDFPKPNPFLRFVRAKVHHKEEIFTVSPAGFDKSSSVASLAHTDAFIMLPGGTRGYGKGMVVDVLLVEIKEGSEWPWSNLFPSYK